MSMANEIYDRLGACSGHKEVYLWLIGVEGDVHGHSSLVPMVHHHLWLPLYLDAQTKRVVVCWQIIQLQVLVLFVVVEVFYIFICPHPYIHGISGMLFSKVLLSASLQHCTRYLAL